MKFLLKLKKKKRTKKSDVYQESLERFGRNQLKILVDKGLGWQAV